MGHAGPTTSRTAAMTSPSPSSMPSTTIAPCRSSRTPSTGPAWRNPSSNSLPSAPGKYLDGRSFSFAAALRHGMLILDSSKNASYSAPNRCRFRVWFHHGARMSEIPPQHDHPLEDFVGFLHYLARLHVD